MDTGKGRFEPLPGEAETEAEIQQMMEAMEKKHPNHGGWFKVGEVVELKGSRFRVKSVKPTELRLKLLPRKEKS